MTTIYFFFRRQKEKRINPACLSPNGSNGSDGNEYTKNLFTASLSSLSSSVPSSVHSQVTAAVSAASVIAAAGGGGGSNRTQDHLPPGSTGSGPNSNNMFHPLAHLGFNSLGGLMNSRHLHSPISNETTSLG